MKAATSVCGVSASLVVAATAGVVAEVAARGPFRALNTSSAVCSTLSKFSPSMLLPAIAAHTSGGNWALHIPPTVAIAQHPACKGLGLQLHNNAASLFVLIVKAFLF